MRTYTEVGQLHRLYNGGDRISEMLTYSLPDGHDIHCVARWSLEAPEKEFFTVPKYLVIGQAQIAMAFLETILRPDRFGGRGVVLLDANFEAPADPEEAEALPVAKTEKDAIAKAGRHWEGYYRRVAQQWIDECNQARANGGVPRSASGFVVRALKLAGIMDPGSTVLATVTKAAPASEGNSEVIRELERLRKKVEDMEKANGAGTAAAGVPVQLSRTAREGRRT